MPDPVTGVLAGTAVIGAGATVYSAKKSSKAAASSTQAQREATSEQSIYLGKMADVAEEQLGLSREQLALAQKESARADQAWNRYTSVFMPIEDELVRQVKEMPEEPPGLARMIGTIDRGYSDLEGNLRRMMAGRYQHGSGLERGTMERTELGRTRAKAGAKADAISAWENEKFNRMMQVAGFGRTSAPLMTVSGGYAAPISTMGSTGNMFTNIAGQYGGQAANYGNMANMYNQATANTWASAGNTAGNLMQMYLLTQGGKGGPPGFMG